MKFTTEKSFEILTRTPIIIENLLSGLPDDWIYNNEGNDTWSPFDVVGHLVVGEKTDWITRMQIILGDAADKKFKVFDRFKQLRDNVNVPLSQLIQEFKMLRQQNLEILKKIKFDEATLNRTGIHPEFG